MSAAIALIISALCYAAASGVAVLPFARAVAPPVRTVLWVLGLGVTLHLVALVLTAQGTGHLSFIGLGPALSLGGFALATTVLVAELLARDTVLVLLGGPLAALVTLLGALLARGQSILSPGGVQGIWLTSHIVLGFVGMAALAVAAAAGTLYLVERRDLKSRHFGSIFRAFPPLETLDRVNHLSAIIGWLGLTTGLILAASYTVVYGQADGPRVVWGVVAWLAASVLTCARVVAGWKARRAAVMSAVVFAVTLASYFAARVVAARPGQFLVSGFPLLLSGDQLSALVVGGGSVAYRKAEALLRSGATVRVVAPRMAPEFDALQAVWQTPRLTLIARAYSTDDVGDALLVVAATDSRTVNQRVARDARALGRLVNVADAPHEGNCATMATHRAGVLVVAVSAGGVPRAAARLRDRIARQYDGRYAAALAALADLRTRLLNDGHREAWHEAERALLGAGFCAAVESGTFVERVVQWA